MAIFINDFTLDECVGGAELVNSYISDQLEIPIQKSRDIKALEPNVTYIISSCITNPSIYNMLALNHIRYIVIEHDYKFCKDRNPYLFNPEGKVPEDQLINLDFYKNAAMVFCQSEFHKRMFEKNNIEANIENAQMSIWNPKDIDKILEIGYNNCLREPKFLIYNHPHPWKGAESASKWCIENGFSYDLLLQAPRGDFLKKMARYSGLVFIPHQPETCCRLVIEAKLMSLNVLTSKNYGASTSDWFYLDKIVMAHNIKEDSKQSIEKIKSYL